MLLKDKTVFITGGSRGIGKAIALKLAAEGANIVIAAKSTEENTKLGGTIYSAAQEVEALGAKALAVKVDIRNEEDIIAAVKVTVEKFGGIDILINNASAIDLSNTEKTEVKRFDLMYDINVRGTFLVTQHCLPHLKNSSNGHIITLSPPVNLDIKWLKNHVAYTLTKYNMSLMSNAWAAEFKKYKIASNTIWPRTTIDTAAVRNILGGETLAKMSRTTEIVADAVFAIVTKPSTECTGNNFIDEKLLAEEGITDLEKYAVTPGGKLYTDLFVDEA